MESMYSYVDKLDDIFIKAGSDITNITGNVELGKEVTNDLRKAIVGLVQQKGKFEDEEDV